MNSACGMRGYMLRYDFSADFRIGISEKVDAYRMSYDAGFQRRRGERLVLNAPTERAIPPSCETTVGRIEGAVTDFENRFNDFFWSQGFLAAMAPGEGDGGGLWPPLSDELLTLAGEAERHVEEILSELPEEEAQRGRRYYQLRREDIDGGAGYLYLHGYEYAFCILETTGHRMDAGRLNAIYAALGLSPDEGSAPPDAHIK